MILNIFLLNQFTLYLRRTLRNSINAFSQQVWRHLCSDVETEMALQHSQKQMVKAGKQCHLMEKPDDKQCQNKGAGSSQNEDSNVQRADIASQIDDQYEASSSQDDSDDEDGTGADLLDSKGYFDIKKLLEDANVSDVKAALLVAQRKRVLKMMDHLKKAKEALNDKASKVIF
jgi:hypothetical protein